ncbi:MAG: TraR/DksA family transcriptional regulator [Patescibacteria group bacterium]|nr:TraR/DksA family transcriptional regulator [Patescibacteria group bacterium]
MENNLDPKILAEIKAELLARKQQILESLEDISQKDPHEADNLGSKFPEYGDKPDENAQEISDYTANSAAEKVLEKTLADIEGALNRIEKGTYGICKYCGQPIAPKRLQARPVASACIVCKTELQENE